MMSMFVPTLRNGFTKEEAVQNYVGFAKRPMDRVVTRSWLKWKTGPQMDIFVQKFMRGFSFGRLSIFDMHLSVIIYLSIII